MVKHKLTVAEVRNLTKPGWHDDGGCLCLNITETGGKNWVMRLTVNEKRKDIGLGGLSYVSLHDALAEAVRSLKITKEGGDPSAKITKVGHLTFEQAARLVYKNLLPTWKGSRHADIWIASLMKYVFPQIGKMSVHAIGSQNISQVPMPIWSKKPDTAKRLKQRLTSIFDWAKSARPRECPMGGGSSSPSWGGRQYRDFAPAFAYAQGLKYPNMGR